MKFWHRIHIWFKHGSVQNYERWRIANYLHKFCQERRRNPEQYDGGYHTRAYSDTTIRRWRKGYYEIVDYDFDSFDSYELHLHGDKIFDVIRGAHGFHHFEGDPTMTLEDILMGMLSSD